MNRWIQIACFVCLLTFIAFGAGCSSSNASSSENNSTPFDTINSPPSNWKLVEEPKWGIRFSVPATMKEAELEKKSLWIYKNDSMSVIVNFGNSPSQSKLRLKKNYKQTILRFNDLEALFCEFDEPLTSNKKAVKKVVAIYFLEKRKLLGALHEPSFQVEYSSDLDKKIALQILQTIHLLPVLQ